MVDMNDCFNRSWNETAFLSTVQNWIVRHSSPKTFITPYLKSDIHHPGHSSPQTFITPYLKSDIHHLRRSSPPHCLSKVANMVLSTRISQILAKLIRPNFLNTTLWCFNRNQVEWLFNYFNQISIKYFHLFHVSKVMFWQANVYFTNNAVRFKLQSILICMNIVNIGLKMFRTSNQRPVRGKGITFLAAWILVITFLKIRVNLNLWHFATKVRKS